MSNFPPFPKAVWNKAVSALVLVGLLALAVPWESFRTRGVDLTDTPQPPAPNKGMVIAVTDGDSLRVSLPAGTLKIRLQGIDAPELKQPGGTTSRAILASLVLHQMVEVNRTGKDRYGRTLANISVEGIPVNLEMIRLGWAWHFKKYSKDGAFAFAEDMAREQKRGLWEEPSPVAPWEWRAQ